MDFCLQEENWMIGDGFKVNSSKFVYSFVDEDGGKTADKNPPKSTKKK